MRGYYRIFGFQVGGLLAAIALVGMVAVLTVGSTSPASALPSFARQTGQPCGTCHTDFPALTPYGRRFKLLGYTPGGGQFRTTPFSSNRDGGARGIRQAARLLHQGRRASVSDCDNDSSEWVPPISMMAILGYTHTQAPLTAADRPLQSK